MTHPTPTPAPMTADENAAMQADKLAHDCILAAECLTKTNLFETGQAILRDAAAAITALTAELATERQAHKQWQEVFERAMDDLAFADLKNEAQAVGIERLRVSLMELLQINDGLPLMGIEVSRRIEAARAALEQKQ